jgi:GntR family transcriptional regulator / MocR family aminotransferase
VPAGLHLLITFPGLDSTGPSNTGPDDTELASRLQQDGVLVQPLSWHRMVSGPPGLVLGYAAHSPDQLREAARRIGRAVHAWAG